MSLKFLDEVSIGDWDLGVNMEARAYNNESESDCLRKSCGISMLQTKLWLTNLCRKRRRSGQRGLRRTRKTLGRSHKLGVLGTNWAQYLNIEEFQIKIQEFSLSLKVGKWDHPGSVCPCGNSHHNSCTTDGVVAVLFRQGILISGCQRHHLSLLFAQNSGRDSIIIVRKIHLI